MRTSEYQVLVYCPLDGGHHLNFARLVATGFARIGVRATLATTEVAERSRELSKVPVPILRVPPLTSRSRAVALMQQVQVLRRLATERAWNRIVLPAGDGLLQALAMATGSCLRVLPPGIPVEALALRGGVAYPAGQLAKQKRRASLRLMEAAPVSHRHHLDPVFTDWARVQPAPRCEWRLMPDPVETPTLLDRRSARDKLGIPTDGIVVGCVGTLDERKGIHLAIDAFQVAHLPRDAHLLLVGQCTPAIKTAVARLGARAEFAGRVHVRDEWVREDTMMAAIEAMDLVIAAYPGHVGSASIVLRVMAGQRPILGSATPWMARHLLGYRAGWLADVESTERFASDLVRAISQAPSWRPSPSVHSLLAFNSPYNFMAHWTRATVTELGRPPVADIPYPSAGPPNTDGVDLS
jgi:glycosyltransferase involved in cell wall biosynthesis